MEKLPKRVRKTLTQDQPTKTSDWVRDAVDKAREIEIRNHEKELIDVLLVQTYQLFKENKYPLGIILAAAYDLLIAAEYYSNVTNAGWFYCHQKQPLLFYPYTNTCPICRLNKNAFTFQKANKPTSGKIGQATSRLLAVLINALFLKANRTLQVFRGSEPIDLVIYDKAQNTLLLAEIKAAPLVTLPLVTETNLQTEMTDEGVTELASHRSQGIADLSSQNLTVMLPISQNEYDLINLGRPNVAGNAGRNWAYGALSSYLTKNFDAFEIYLRFWNTSFEAYTTRDRSNNFYWLTNGCGQPSPRPTDWPTRTEGEGGFESVSDGKTSVGMDRTDDIKKGIYQVLKIGAESKPKKSELTVKTGLVSNIKAIRHYDEYLTSLQDIVWTLDKTGQAKQASDLPANTEIYNLFDGIITFTESHIRDEWLSQIFNFEA